jgi:ketosteroid isomerase-like protein
MTHVASSSGELIRALFSAVDNADFDTIAALTARNIHFRFGNSDPTDTQTEFMATARSFRAAVDDLRHTLVDLWEVGDVVIAVMDVFYRRHDGVELQLPCCNVFRVGDGLVHSYLIYMDINPVFAP